MTGTDTTEWFYAQGDEERGPVPMADLLRLVEKGTVGRGTLVWHDGMEDWSPAGQVEGLQLAWHKLDEAWSALPRPWVRFWARMIDIGFGMFFSAMLVGPVLTPMGPQGPFFLVFLLLVFTNIILEALVVSTFGWTPGKWMLRVRLRTPEGACLGFSAAAVRSFLVWVRGMFFLIFPVNIIMFVLSWRDLRRHGNAWWDRAGNHEVRHGNIGPFRGVAAGILLFFYGIVMAFALWFQIQVIKEQLNEIQKEMPPAVEQHPTPMA